MTQPINHCAHCKTPLFTVEDFYVDAWEKVWNLCWSCGAIREAGRPTL